MTTRGCSRLPARSAGMVMVIVGSVSAAHADDCTAVVAAEIAQAKVPYEITSVTSVPGKPDDRRVIVIVDDKMYVQLNGVWQSTPVAAQQTIDRINKMAKEHPGTCTRQGTDAVGGDAASVYSSRDPTKTTIAESRIWISDRSGLPVKSEVHFAGGKTMIATYRYGDVAAPPGAK
jgi:hypothetical protein